MYCYAEIVPSTNDRTFYKSPINDAILHVPANSINAYKTTEPWSGFKSIVALTEEEMSIHALELKTSDEPYYTLDGRKLQGKPTLKGVYIVNGIKVVIK